jgi:HlyD family secretion protein
MDKRKRLILPIALVAMGLIVGYVATRNRSSANSPVIRVSGNFEVTDAEVSFKISGRVEERLVDEGEGVRAGQIVARLESRELAQEVALRKAELLAAKAVLAELVAGSRPEEIAQAEAAAQQAKARLDEMVAGFRPQEVEAAKAAVSRSRAEVERLRADHERQETLFRRQVIAAREHDAVVAAVRVAEARLREDEERLKLVQEGTRREQIEQARAALKQAQEQFAMVREGPRKETIEAARARVTQAEATLAGAETRLGYTELLSPLTGLVLSKNIEPGEYAAPGTPVVTVGDLEHIWLRAYINETDLGRIKVGQRVRVKTDTFPGKVYEGRVSFIASQAEFTPKNVQTERERVKLVYRIKVDVPNPQMELKPGMPADGEIILGQP